MQSHVPFLWISRFFLNSCGAMHTSWAFCTLHAVWSQINSSIFDAQISRSFRPDFSLPCGGRELVLSHGLARTSPGQMHSYLVQAITGFMQV